MLVIIHCMGALPPFHPELSHGCISLYMCIAQPKFCPSIDKHTKAKRKETLNASKSSINIFLNGSICWMDVKRCRRDKGVQHVHHEAQLPLTVRAEIII
eukprot:2564143-Amphidinium_carterae.1